MATNKRRIARMRISTKFWKEENIEVWRSKVDKINFFYGIFFTANFLYYLMTEGSIAMMIINLIPLTTAVIVVISRKKHSKEVSEWQKRKEEQQKNKKRS